MKKTYTRKEVSQILVEDKYYTKGNWWTKIYQTLIALLGFGGIFFAFGWVLMPLLFPKLFDRLGFEVFTGELVALQILAIFLGVLFIIFTIVYIALTIRNNHQFKNYLQKEKLHDEERLETRKALMEAAYTERFGAAEFRHSVRYYSVKEEQNLDTEFVRELYKEGGVDL
ncbi:MAG: cell division protein [Enterococcus sp.]